MIPIYRPAPTPDLDTPETGRVWYYLTEAGMKLEIGTAYVYAKGERSGRSVYGGEFNSYIYADDTPRSWENICGTIEAALAASGFSVVNRPPGMSAVRNKDGTVRGERYDDILVRHSGAIIKDAFAVVDGEPNSGTMGLNELRQLATLAASLRARLDSAMRRD